MSKITVIGAGKTGRGFIGRLLYESSADFAFVDKNEELVNSINEKGFEISFFGNVRESIGMDGYKAYTWENCDIADSELLIVSVGGSNLKDVGTELGKRLRKDKSYAVITCENATDPAGKLKKAIGLENVSVSEATVFCTTIENGGIDISSENYPYLQCNKEALMGYEPPVLGIRPVEQFGNFLTRKLFTYNAASCVIAYLGWLKGYTGYADAANDEEILKMLDENYKITNRVLCREFGYDEKDQEEFALLSRNKFTNRTIADTIQRNAREPQRKLQKEERVIGPMLVMERYGEDSSVLKKTCAAMLIYDNDGEDEWRKIKSELSLSEILEKYSGIEKGSELSKSILAYAEEYMKIMK